MTINTQLLTDFQGSGSKILAVTKYFDPVETFQNIESLKEYSELIVGYGENRIQDILEKNMPREQVHFIGNIQSRVIKQIISHCSHIHSVGSKKHLLKIIEQSEQQKLHCRVFLQYRLDEKKDIGFSRSALRELHNEIKLGEYVQIIGISAMGTGEFTPDQKRGEFQDIISLRNDVSGDLLISAGTSRDCDIAREMGIDIVRIGKKLFS